MDVHRTIRMLLRVSLLLAILAAGLAAGQVQAAPADQPRPALAQFTHGDHVLGFGAGGVYFAGLTHALHVQFIGGALNTPVTTAATSTGDHTAQPFERAAYSNVWPGVDIVYTAAPGTIAESTYVVHPGARVSDIRLHYNTKLERTQDGGLRFSFANGYMAESAPIAWQEVNGKRVPVQVSFQVLGPQDVGFTVGAYVLGMPLIIDPAYEWHTFYGSSTNDYGYGMALDSSGNIYIVGASYATWNGPADELPLHAYVGGADIVVVKLDNAGAYQWHTFYGSNYDDFGNAVTLDSGANIYVLGRSFYGWNGNGGLGPLNPHSGAGKANLVILKLSTYGGYYWHTFFYGSTLDHNHLVGGGIAVDSNFNVYVAGTSNNSWIAPYDVRPGTVTTQDVNGAEPLNPYSGGDDILVIKLNNDGNYAWHSFYGSASDDSGRDIVVDGAGRLVVIGDSEQNWKGPGGILPLRPYKGGRDIVVIKLNGAGAYYWHTFFGSLSDDFGYAVTTDSTRSIYLTGNSYATWNGPGAAPPRSPFTASSDMVVMKLTEKGTYRWHTFHGGAGADYGRAIAIGDTGAVYVGGTSGSPWSVPGEAGPLDPFVSGTDMVTLKLNNDGRYGWHAFYGGSADDGGSSIAIDTSGTVFLAGTSGANWNGVGSVVPLHASAGGKEITVVATRPVASKIFRSLGTYDGWVLESSETSNAGGILNSTATTLRVGDDASNRQYRDILHFDTDSLPDNAVIVSAVLSTKVQGVVGVDPSGTHGNLLVDVHQDYFGSLADLQLGDFNATASRTSVGALSVTSTSAGWKFARLQGTAFEFIKRIGTTQFRLRFALDDNNDSIADYLTLSSGDDLPENTPILEVIYYVP